MFYRFYSRLILTSFAKLLTFPFSPFQTLQPVFEDPVIGGALESGAVRAERSDA